MKSTTSSMVAALLSSVTTISGALLIVGGVQAVGYVLVIVGILVWAVFGAEL